MEDGKSCNCMCHKMVGILVALFGLVLLLGAIHVLSPKIVHLALPVLIILGGLKMSMKGICSCCKDS